MLSRRPHRRGGLGTARWDERRNLEWVGRDHRGSRLQFSGFWGWMRHFLTLASPVAPLALGMLTRPVGGALVAVGSLPFLALTTSTRARLTAGQAPLITVFTESSPATALRTMQQTQGGFHLASRSKVATASGGDRGSPRACLWLRGPHFPRQPCSASPSPNEPQPIEEPSLPPCSLRARATPRRARHARLRLCVAVRGCGSSLPFAAARRLCAGAGDGRRDACRRRAPGSGFSAPSPWERSAVRRQGDRGETPKGGRDEVPNGSGDEAPKRDRGEGADP